MPARQGRQNLGGRSPRARSSGGRRSSARRRPAPRQLAELERSDRGLQAQIDHGDVIALAMGGEARRRG
jgi:hypothetical protein